MSAAPEWDEPGELIEAEPWEAESWSPCLWDDDCDGDAYYADYRLPLDEWGPPRDDVDWFMVLLLAAVGLSSGLLIVASQCLSPSVGWAAALVPVSLAIATVQRRSELLWQRRGLDPTATVAAIAGAIALAPAYPEAFGADRSESLARTLMALFLALTFLAAFGAATGGLDEICDRPARSPFSWDNYDVSCWILLYEVWRDCRKEFLRGLSAVLHRDIALPQEAIRPVGVGGEGSPVDPDVLEDDADRAFALGPQP